MNDGGGKRGVRGGQNLLPKLSKPAQCEEDKRLLCASHRRVAWGEGGVGNGGCTGTDHQGARGAVHGRCSETEMYKDEGLRSQ